MQSPPSSTKAPFRLWRRVLFWGLSILSGLVVLLIAALFSLPLVLPWLATERVPGWLAAAGLPPISLEIEEAGWSKMTMRNLALGEAVRVDYLSLSMNPLARSFGRLQMSGLALTAVQDKSGAWSVPGLYPLPTVVAKPAEAAPPWQDVVLALGPSLALIFDIDNSTINLQTPQAQQKISIEAFTLSGPLFGGLEGQISGQVETRLTDQPNAPVIATLNSDWQAGSSRLVLANTVASLAIPQDLHWQGLVFPAGSEWVVTANDTSTTALTLAFPSRLLPPFTDSEDPAITAAEPFRIIPSLILVSPALDIGLPSGNRLHSTYDGITIGGSLSLTEAGDLAQVALTGSLRDGTVSVGGLTINSMESDLTRVDGQLAFTLSADILSFPGEDSPDKTVATQPGASQKPFRLKLMAHQHNDDPPKAAEQAPALPPMAFQASVSTAQGQDLLQVDGVHDILKGKGQASVKLPLLSFEQNGLQPGHLHRALLGTITSTSGQVSGAGSVKWSPTGVVPDVKVSLKHVSVSRGFLTLNDINGTFRLTQFWPPRTPEKQRVTIAGIDAGLPLTDGTIDFHFDGQNALVLEHASMTLAQGAISLADVTIPLDHIAGTIPLQVRAMNLRSLSRYSQLEGLSISGSVSGTLPLILTDADILIADGELTSDRAGFFRYRPPGDMTSLTAGNAGMALLLTALDDFRYKALRLTVNGSAAGELTVGLHIAGANPALYDGYPLEFNLSLTGGLSNLISSTVESATVPDRVRKHLEGLMDKQNPTKPKPVPTAKKKPDR